MTSKELLYVTTIAEEKNISRAAQKLFVAQPSLSQSLQRIEENLGTRLFNRTANGLTLTYAGERYYHMATQILKMYNSFETEVSDINNLRTGRIHLGTTNHLGTIVLSRVMPAFHQLCPNIEVNVTEENSSVLDQKLLSGELDFAVMHAPAKEDLQPLIQYDLLQKDPFLIVLKPGHPLIQQAVSDPGSPYPVLDVRLLRSEPFIMLHKQQRIRQVTDAVLKKARISQPKILLTLRNYETAQLLAAQGMGVTLVPTEYTNIVLPRYRPAYLSIPQRYDASWTMCISTLKSGFLSKADHMFIDLVKKEFGATPSLENHLPKDSD